MAAWRCGMSRRASAADRGSSYAARSIWKSKPVRRRSVNSGQHCNTHSVRMWLNLRVDALLELIGDVQGQLDIVEFRLGLLAALSRAVSSDWVSLNDLGTDPGESVVLIEPPFPAEDHALIAMPPIEWPAMTARSPGGARRTPAG